MSCGVLRIFMMLVCISICVWCVVCVCSRVCFLLCRLVCVLCCVRGVFVRCLCAFVVFCVFTIWIMV